MSPRAVREKAVHILLPLLLAVYPFIHSAQGLDIADTTYALTGYTWISEMDRMWLLATWLPNLLGALFTHLPGGDTLAGMTAYCTLVQSLIALIAWFVLGRIFSEKEIWLRFLMIWIAESLCWCPAVILYNYLSWLFMTLVTVFLLLAFHEDPGTGEGDPERIVRRRLFIAGVCAGISLFIRFPNAVYVLFILALWYHAFLAGHRKNEILRDTGICILGYISGVIIPLVIVSIRYGISAWPDMIRSLFSMTGGAEDYSAGGMLGAVFGAYLTTASEMVPMLAVLITGVLLSLAMSRRPALRRIMIFLYAFLLAFLFRIYWGRGIFTANYWYYDSVFELAMMLIILSLILDVLAVFGVLAVPKLHRTAAFLSLLQILLLPLGSNNYTFPVVNNLFLILPVTGSLFFAAFRRMGDISESARSRFRSLAAAAQFPVFALGVVLTLLLAFQGVRFHLVYSFGDGMDNRARNVQVTGVPRAAGIMTSAPRAAALQDLYTQIEELKKKDPERTALIYGNAPGLHYLLDLPPALFTAWPDLNSNETVRVKEAIDELAEADVCPLAILRRETLSPWTGNAADKEQLILDYLEKMHYNELFRVDGESDVVYIVYDRDDTAKE